MTRQLGSHFFLYVLTKNIKSSKPHSLSRECTNFKIMCNSNDGLGWRLFDDLENDLSDSLNWWNVDPKGNIQYKGGTKSSIKAGDLTKCNYLTHILKKVRPDAEKNANAEFYFAYLRALKNAGFKKITIDVCNPYTIICE